MFLQEALSESEDDDWRTVREHAAGGDGADAGRAAGEDLRGHPRTVPGPGRGRRHRVRREAGKGLLTLIVYSHCLGPEPARDG